MSFWGQLVGSVKDVAPALAGAAGTALTGGNPIAGAALAALARKVTNGSPSENLDDLAEEILGDSDKLMEFRIESRKLELEELRLRTMDVQDARKMRDHSMGATLVSSVVLVGYFISMLVAMLWPIPPDSVALAYLLLGNLATGFGMVLSFWLGSSKSSKEIDATLERYVDAAKSDAAVRKGLR